MIAVLAWLRANLAAIPALLIGAAIAYPVGLSIGGARARMAEQARLGRIAAAAEHLQRAADHILTQRGAAASAAITANRKAIDDALVPIPDAAPTARQRARACLELRRQADAAREPLPAC